MSSFIFVQAFLSLNLFARMYGSPSEEYGGFSIAHSGDGGFVSVGGIPISSVGDEVLVFKVDPLGGLSWAITYGPGLDSDEDVYCVKKTSDGGFVMAGMYGAFGPTLYADALVMKVDASGNLLWARAYGGTSDDAAYCVEQTGDGGYITAGFGYNIGGGSADVVVLKLNSSGGLSWGRRFGGAGWDNAYSIIQTSDGGFALAGETESAGAGNRDFLVIKLDPSGSTSWARVFGGPALDEASSIIQTQDGGYIVVGGTGSYGSGGWDIMVMRLNSSGSVVWAKVIGGPGSEWGSSVIPAYDNGFIIAGYTGSAGAGNTDFLLLKIDDLGNLQWARTWGTNANDVGRDIMRTADGGYAITGYTYVSGSSDAVIIKLNYDGTYPDCFFEWNPTVLDVSPASQSVGWGNPYAPSSPWITMMGSDLTMNAAELCPSVSGEEKFPLGGEASFLCIPVLGGLVFRSSLQSSVSVYRPDGRMIYSGRLNPGETRISLERGLYIWKAGSRAGSAVVR
jgi:hypothetical protein